MRTVDKSPGLILRTSADALGNEDCDSDDLVQAVGDVEVGKVGIAELFSPMLDQTFE